MKFILYSLVFSFSVSSWGACTGSGSSWTSSLVSSANFSSQAACELAEKDYSKQPNCWDSSDSNKRVYESPHCRSERGEEDGYRSSSIPPCYNPEHPDYDSDYCGQKRNNDAYEKDQDRLDRIRQAEEDRIREEREARKDAEQAVEDARREEERKNKQWETKEKELKDKCEGLDDRLYQAQLDKRDKLRDYENRFYEMEEDIKREEAQLTEDEIKLDDVLDNLRKNSEKEVQRLKDQMEGELAGLDQQIQRIEGAIDGIEDAFNKIKEQEMKLFYEKRKSQNEAYIKCYELTQTNVLKRVEEYRRRASTGQLRRQRMSDLIDGDSGSTSQQFNEEFNRELSRCVNSEVAQRMRVNQENDFQLIHETIELQRNSLEEKKQKLLAEIQELNTDKKVEVLNDFKERMETVVDEFERSHERANDQAKRRREHALSEINNIKQKQARELSRREEEMNMDARDRQKVDECHQEQALNFFKTNQERQQAWIERRRKQQQQTLQNQQRQIESLLKSRINNGGAVGGSGFGSGGLGRNGGSSSGVQ